MIKLSILGRDIVLSPDLSYSGDVAYYVAEITSQEFKLLSDKKHPQGYFTSIIAVEENGWFKYWVVARNYNTGDTLQVLLDWRKVQSRLMKSVQTSLFNEVEFAQPDLFN